MFKKIIKTILIIIIILLAVLAYFSIIKPAYIDYKKNKKEIVVDTSGERATSQNKVPQNTTKNKSSNENTFKVEKKEYDSVIFDDRILLYEGEIDSKLMEAFVKILIEDTEDNTYSKIDMNINGVEGIASQTISFDDKEQYISTLNKVKDSISEDKKYIVDFEYNSLRSIVNKITITQK